jgi:hypothetical protein
MKFAVIYCTAICRKFLNLPFGGLLIVLPHGQQLDLDKLNELETKKLYEVLKKKFDSTKS